MKSLAELLEYLELNTEIDIFWSSPQQIEQPWSLHSISNDSRQVSDKSVFVAVQGERSHALDYLKNSLQQGCQCILADRAPDADELSLCREFDAVFIFFSGLQDSLATLVNWFYDKPSSKLKVIGITGTNGKTSTAFFCAQILQALGAKVALIGTLGYGVFGKLQKGMNTTPDVVQVHRLMAQFVEQQVDFVVMEVSSHAIELGRVAEVNFATLALTQVSSDHLDFHGSQENYEKAKVRLFHEFQADHKVLNLDDHIGARLVDCNHPYGLQQGDCVLLGYSLAESDLSRVVQPKKWQHLCVNHARDLQLSSQGLKFELQHGDEQLTISAPLFGVFNAENLLCAISCVMAHGYELPKIVEAACKVNSVAGRMQLLHRQPSVLVDFAHTEDALLKLLQAVRQHQTETNNIWIVFGCGGDRDRQKRPRMAQVAEQYADKIVITSDNPRHEEPQAIIDEVVTGLVTPEEAIIELDRQVAIEKALQQVASDRNAIVVIAGKGHEDYQEIKGQRYPFSDASIVEQWFAKQAS